MVHNLPCESAASRFASFRVWHMLVLVVYVAVAIVDLREARTTDPMQIGSLSAGYAGYAALGWAGWVHSRPSRRRADPLPGLVAYLVAMAILFLVAAIVHSMILNVY